MRTKGTKNKPKESPFRDTETVTETDGDSFEQADKSGKRIGLAVYLDDAGKVDFSRMHKKSREQLIEVLSLPEISSLIGGPEQVKEVSKTFDPKWAGSFLNGLMMIAGMISQKFAGLSSDSCSRAFKLTDNEQQMMSPVFAEIIDKYMDKYKIDFVKEFKQEIVLFIMLTATIRTKFVFAKELDEKRMRVVQPMTATIDDAQVSETIGQ